MLKATWKGDGDARITTGVAQRGASSAGENKSSWVEMVDGFCERGDQKWPAVCERLKPITEGKYQAD